MNLLFKKKKKVETHFQAKPENTSFISVHTSRLHSPRDTIDVNILKALGISGVNKLA